MSGCAPAESYEMMSGDIGNDLTQRTPGYLRRAGARDATLIAIGLIAIAAAGWFFTRGSTGDKPPTDQYVEFHCSGCNADFRLSYAEFEEYWGANNFERLSDGRTLRYRCTKCGEMTANRLGKDRLGAAPPGP